MKVVVTFLLLVAGIEKCAVAGNLSPGQRRDVTSLLDTSDADAHLNVLQRLSEFRFTRSLPSLAVEHGPVSVVQDWSLVCVQLCGAALGGDPCTPYCTSVTVPEDVRKSNAEILLSLNKDVICQDLCALKLGGDICTCSTAVTAQSVEDRNQICQTFCENNQKTLAGCSICHVIETKTQWITNEKKAAAEEKIKDSTGDKAANPAFPAIITSTTPDWDALCATLCKTGDGGSLCNCDLSPFF